MCPYRESFPKNKNNSYIDYITTTLTRRLTYHLSENTAIKQHLIIKHNNSTEQLTSSDVRKIIEQLYKKIIIKTIKNPRSKMHKLKKKNLTYAWAPLLIETHETLVPFEVISSGCNARVVPLQYLLEVPMEVLLCKRVNDLRHSLFQLLNCLITTASELRE